MSHPDPVVTLFHDVVDTVVAYAQLLRQQGVDPAMVHDRSAVPVMTKAGHHAFSRFNTARSDVVDLTLVEPVVVEVSGDMGWDGQNFRHLLRFVRARPELSPMEVSPPSRIT